MDGTLHLSAQLNTQSAFYYKFHSLIHIELLSMPECFLTFTHSDRCIMQREFQHFAQQYLRLEESGINPPTFKLVENLLYHLSHSHLNSQIEILKVVAKGKK